MSPNQADHIVPWVFFRMVAKGRGGEKRPKPIRAFGKAWKSACRAAGCPGRIPHDLRRTAVRNFVRWYTGARSDADDRA
jgi:integrase